MGSRPSEGRAAALDVLRGVVARERMSSARVLAGAEHVHPRLLPLVAHSVADWTDADDPRVQRLRAAERDAEVRWLARKWVVRHLDGVLRAQHVKPIFLKGVALAESVFERPALRPMSDVDVWVREGWPEAVTALGREGYSIPPRHGDGVHGIDQRTAVLERRVGPGAILVEVHDLPASLYELPKAEQDRLWSERIALPHTGVEAFEPSGQLLHLCLHLSRANGFEGGLASVMDIALLLRERGSAIDWGAWSTRARVAGATASLWTPLAVARSVLGAAVPDEVLLRLRPNGAERLEAGASEQLWLWGGKNPAAAEFVLRGDIDVRQWLYRRFVQRHIDRGRAAEGGGARGRAFRSFLSDLRLKLPLYLSSVRGGPGRMPLWARARAARQRGRLLRTLRAGDAQAREKAPDR